MAERDAEFYVGYLPSSPPELARRTRRVVAGVIACALALAAALVSLQAGFGPGVFEFGTERELRGVIEAAPYPVLAVPRPSGGRSRYLLTAFGKHGAGEMVRPFVGRAVVARGTLAYREGATMLELADDGLRFDEHAPPVQAEVSEDLGETTLRGEIVDSKCWMGVMKPGNTKAHRDCAVRCISGGIPPVLLSRDREGRARYTLLVGPDGASLNHAVLDLVAEPVEARGRLSRSGELFTLRVADGGLQRLE